MKKLSFLTLIMGLLMVCITSCNKEKMEMRRTHYFTTEVDSTADELTLYIEDEKIGIIPYVKGGITDPADRSLALKYTLKQKENKIVVKNSIGKEVAKATIKSAKYRTYNETETNLGEFTRSIYDLEEFTGTFVHVNL
jgi:hypothetical protein